jgi:GT2 family glycosyltransferase
MFRKIKKEFFPFVSVIVCTYNRSEYLTKCLNSLLDQTYDNFEVIIVNGPSIDETDNLLKKYPFRVIQQKGKRGLSAARNQGIKAAKGEIIALIDDDAIADNNWIKYIIKKYIDESIGSVGGATYYMSDSKVIEMTMALDVTQFGRPRGTPIDDNNSKYVRFKFVHGCNCSFRKKIFEEIGGFDEYYTYWLDETDLCVRIAKAGYEIDYEPNAVVYHAKEGSNRPDVWYHISEKQLYFAFKNFGNVIPIEKILYEDFKNFMRDLKKNTIGLIRYKINFLEYVLSVKNLIIGRIYGYRDGIFIRKKYKNNSNKEDRKD